MSVRQTIICNAGPVIALGKLNRLDLMAAVCQIDSVVKVVQ